MLCCRRRRLSTGDRMAVPIRSGRSSAMLNTRDLSGSGSSGKKTANHCESIDRRAIMLADSSSEAGSDDTNPVFMTQQQVYIDNGFYGAAI